MWRGLPFRILPPLRLLTLGMVTVALVGIIRLELPDGAPDEAPAMAEPVRKQPPSLPASASHERSKHQDDEDVAMILARPLFSPTRRPPALAPAPKHGAPELARLTGVVVSPAGKSAIFAGAEGSKPVVVGEGGHIGQYVVQTINLDTVTVNGLEGQRTVHPVFDLSSRTHPIPSTLKPSAKTIQPIIAPAVVPASELPGLPR